VNRDNYAAPCTVGRCTRPADFAQYCCSQCVNTMLRHLREIEDYATTLDVTPGRGGNTGRRSPGYGSRPPARLDVIAALDPRTVPHAIGPDDTDGDVRSILGTLTALAQWVAEECDDPRPLAAPTIATETRYLRNRILWATGQQWVDELAEDLRQLHRQVVTLAGDSARPLAPCPSCAGPLWPAGNGQVLGVRCGQCGTEFTSLDLLRIGAAMTQGVA